MIRNRLDPSRNTHRSQSARRLVVGVTLVLLICRSSVFTQERTPRDAGVASAAFTLPSTWSDVGLGRGGLVEQHHDNARETQSPVAASPQGWIGRHPVVFGTLIGAGGGIAWQASACRGPSCKVGFAGLVGAGTGAYAGLIASAVHNAKLKRPVGRGTKIAIAAGAIAGAVGVALACYGAGGCGGTS
jgi:hypothetical protein